MVKKKFKVIHGGKDEPIQVGSLSVIPTRQLPVAVDAVVVEEDTWLLMSAPPEVRQPKDHLIRIMTDILDHLPMDPGKVMIRKGQPDELLAVVNELVETTESREAWVREALETIFSEAERAPYQRLALPYLGTKHGGLPEHVFLMTLKHTILDTLFASLKSLYLIVPTNCDLLRAKQAFHGD